MTSNCQRPVVESCGYQGHLPKTLIYITCPTVISVSHTIGLINNSFRHIHSVLTTHVLMYATSSTFNTLPPRAISFSLLISAPQNNIACALFLIVTTTNIILRYIMYSSQRHCFSAIISFVCFRDSSISLAALSIPDDAMIFKKQLPLYYLHQI